MKNWPLWQKALLISLAAAGVILFSQLLLYLDRL
jgi:hypothetical protein